MSSVFISYAHDDEAFVRELVVELEARENQAWVDWEGIPPTAEWWEEIKRGIEGADALVFVLTPHSAKSEVCRRELDHAVALNKRIVPVLRLRVEAEAVPEAVAARQWITFLESVSVPSGTDDLVDALDLDLEWLRGHTRWLVEALEWERSDRDGSTLARRRALAAAEAWLDTGAGGEKEPPPTPLHYDYILASRRAATRRQRAGVTIVLAALVVLTALTAAALLERDRAVSQRRLAVSRGLLQAASGEVGRRIDRQMLLTIESYRHDPTVDARSGLVAAVQRAARLRRVFGPFASPPDNVAITRNGGGVVVATRGGTIYRRGGFEEADPRRLSNVRSAAALSRDGAFAAAATPYGISVWRLGAKQPLGTLHGGGSDDFRADEPIAVEQGKTRRLLLVTRGGQVVIWNSSSGATLDRTRVRRYVAAAAADAHGEVLAVAGSTGLEVFHINRRSDRLGDPVQYDTAPQRDVSVAPSGNIAASVSVRGDVVLWDLRHRSRPRPLQVRQVATTVDFSPDGRRLAVGDAVGGVTIWRVSDREPATTLDGHGNAILDIAFTEAELATSSIDGTVDLWTPTRVPYEQELTTPSSRQFHDVEYSPDSHWLAAAGFGVGITAWDMSTSPPHLLHAIGDPNEPLGETSIDFGSSTHLLAVATNIGSSSSSMKIPSSLPSAATGGAYLVDLLSRHRRALLTGSAVPDAIAYADSAPIVVWPQRGRQLSISAGTLSPSPSRVMKLRGAPNDLAVDAGGNVLAAATNEGLELFDVRTRQPLNAPAARTRVSAVVFSSDGKRLFAATDQLGVVIWDVRAGRLLATIPVRSANDVAVTPDGKVLAVVTENGAVRLWDIARRRSLGRPVDLAASAVSFSPDGRHLVTAGGTVHVWNSVLWSADEARGFLCRAVGHNLTRGDWSRFLPGDRYRKTCE